MKEMNIYKITLTSNCYTCGYTVDVASETFEEAVSKAKKHLEEDIDNINIEVISVTKVMENVIV